MKDFGSGMKNWSADATDKFKGKIVSHIRYTTADEMRDLDWSHSAPIIFFTDGSYVMASSDDEGNSSGALWTDMPGMEIIPRGGE